MPRKKTPKTPPPERVSPEDRANLRKWMDGHDDPEVRALAHKGREVRRELEKCLNWHRENRKERAIWQLAYRNWLFNHLDYARREKPQYDLGLRESGPDNVTHISDLIRKISDG